MASNVVATSTCHRCDTETVCIENRRCDYYRHVIPTVKRESLPVEVQSIANEVITPNIGATHIICKDCTDRLGCMSSSWCVKHKTITALPNRVKVSAANTSVKDTLAERGKRYGDFAENAAYAQDLKAVLKGHSKYYNLDATKKEALEVIMQKISRIVCGDPNYKDNWHDIAGYATLAEERCTSPDEHEKTT